MSGQSPLPLTDTMVAGASFGQANWTSCAAAIEAGSPCDGNRMRLDVTTRLRLSASSRSSRSCSSGEPRQPRTTIRRLTAANTEVTRGTRTMTV